MKSYKLLYLLLPLFLLLSCEDFITRDHPTSVTDNDFWQTQSQVESALSSCVHLPYGCRYWSTPYYNRICFEGTTDNLYHPGFWLRAVRSIGNSTITPSETQIIREFWENRYLLIRRCCRLIENIDKSYFTLEEERGYILGEAYVYRAMYHMELLFYYGFHEGIPVMMESLSGENIYMERQPVDVAADLILEDLDKAEQLLPFKWDEGRSTRMSGATAVALKSTVNLNVKRYAEAAAEAKKIIDSGMFELFYTPSTDNTPGKNYRDLFYHVGEVNDERILYRTDGAQGGWRLLAPGINGAAVDVPTRPIVDAYETKQGKTIFELGSDSIEIYQKDPLYNFNRDPRLYHSIMVPGDDYSFPQFNYKYNPFNKSSVDHISQGNASPTGFVCKKFADPLDKGTPDFGGIDYMIIRYAEILLNYVEALVESGNFSNPDVVKHLNEIRRRADMPDVDVSVYNTQDKLRELYRRERRIELAFEGQRIWDIRRWGIGEEVMNGQVLGAFNPASGEFIQVETRFYDSPKNDQWPIHNAEVTTNLKLKQNSGW